MKDRRMRIAVAGIFHETNTFAPGKTDEEAFRYNWTNGNKLAMECYSGTRTIIGGVIDASKTHDIELSAGLYAEALPGGIVTASTAELLLDSLLESINPEADGIVLVMHGAMVSENYYDFEGECLNRVRERFGNKFPIVLTLDLHANISGRMVELSDVIVGFDTYPHSDMYERGYEACELLAAIVNGNIHPFQAYTHTDMLIVPQGMMTEEGSMKLLMDRAFQMEKDDSVLNVTVAGGFPYSDIEDAGMSFVVTTDGDPQLAAKYAAELNSMAIELSDTFNVVYCSPREAIEQALAQPEGPVIVAEGSDNVGGGAPADATHILAHLIGVPERALIVIHDAEAAINAAAAGIGNQFSGLIGGKSDTLHGAPVMVQGEVQHLFNGIYRNIGTFRTGQLVDMGTTAVVVCGNLTVMLTEKRVAPFDLGHIRYAGLWPTDFKIIIVKSAIAWQAAFGEFAKHVIHVDTPGCCSANLNHFQYKNVRNPIYPTNLKLVR